MAKLLLAVALLASCPAYANDVRLTYAAYAADLNVMRMAIAFSLTPEGYEVAISGRTTGLVGALYHATWTSTAHGAWAGGDVQPELYVSDGLWGGKQSRVTLGYSGHDPVVRELVPRDDGYHEPVDPALAHDTIDSLSAMALLIRRVASTGTCDGEVRVFDGRRLSVVAVRTSGPQTLPPTGRSSWQGAALRCDFEGRELAGFPRDLSPAEAHRPHRGSAWLARLAPDGPPLPVRVVFESRWVGAATLYLTGGFVGDLPAPSQIP
jgi:hypothetical protein